MDVDVGVEVETEDVDKAVDNGGGIAEAEFDDEDDTIAALLATPPV